MIPLFVKLVTSSLTNSSAIDSMNIPSEQRVNYLGYTRAMWRDLLVDLNEKPFHANQLMKWIHHCLFDDFTEMTDISKNLRQHPSSFAPRIAYGIGPSLQFRLKDCL